MAGRLSIIVVAKGEPQSVAQALGSAQGADAQRLITGDLEANGLAEALAPFAGGLERVHCTDGPAAARNAALAQAAGDYVIVLDGHERLSEGALDKHREALDADPELIGSYGRTAIHEAERVRTQPEKGKGGSVYRRLLKEKHLISSSACLMWRREGAEAALFNPDYASPQALRLSLALDLSRDGAPFAFHPTVVAERAGEPLDLPCLEEIVKILLGVLYSPEALEEKTEQRARFRLARYLVAMGKLHYRDEDYQRAGKFFDEAVRSAPSYFKGRRYQFLNFVKNTLSRER